MRIFRQKSGFVWLVLAALLCSSAVPSRVFADDKESSTPPPKSALAKPDSPAPLTERERWMLDRIGQLEKRMAELESKRNPPVTPAKAVSPPQPISPNLSTSSLPTGATSAAPAAVASTNVIPTGKTLALGTAQATEKGKSSGAKAAKAEPFAFADFTWLTGNARTKESPLDTKFFTPEIRADVDYIYDFNHPKDNTIGGSSEVFRANEVQVTQLGVGGDFHYDNVRARLMTQFGLYSQTTPRNDASYSRGQWNLADAYRYLSEAYGGYHWDALHGINVDAGIFMSYVGLFSYYNFDNWAYQPSFVSSNTPWFFTGMRIQVFPTKKLKIEPWIINGWQSYARFNGRLGFGGQVLYRPTGWLSLLSNNYGAGADALGIPTRTRYHTDNSIEVKYYDHPERFLDKTAFSLTGDAGCESGGGVNCTTNQKDSTEKIISYKHSFLGHMLYNRWWFHHDG